MYWTYKSIYHTIRTRRQGHKEKKKARKNKIKGQKKDKPSERKRGNRVLEREIKLPTRVERERERARVGGAQRRKSNFIHYEPITKRHVEKHRRALYAWVLLPPHLIRLSLSHWLWSPLVICAISLHALLMSTHKAFLSKLACAHGPHPNPQCPFLPTNTYYINHTCLKFVN